MRLWVADGEVEFQPRQVVIAGYTGRDRALVDRHIEELREEGVPAPPRVPMYWEAPGELFCDAPSIEVRSAQTSGEVEPVLIVAEDGDWYVGVGSDHTDRALERIDIADSKRACAKVVAPQVWPYEEIAGRWDGIRLSSRVCFDSGGWTAYQAGELGTLLPLDQILRGLRSTLHMEPGPGLAIFLGTVPLLHGSFCYGSAFAMEMTDPGPGRSISWQYEVDVGRL
jgi:(2Fe-2S) ferredoxin